LHHDKHFADYTTKLNAAVKGTEMEGLEIPDLISKYSTNSVVRNMGGGFYNHCQLFLKFMGPNGGGQPSGDLADAINASFGTFSNFVSLFSAAASARFGSGWAWLNVKED